MTLELLATCWGKKVTLTFIMREATRKDNSRLAGFLADPRRALWKLSLPILGGMAIHTLYSVVDMIFVGWVGPDAVAALAFNMPLVFFAYGMTMGLSSGVTAVMAQAIGGKDKVRADNTAEHAVALGLVVGLAISAVSLIWGPRILFALGATGEINTLAWSYFQVISWGLTFSVLSAFFRGILTGEGDTMRPMAILGLGMVLNIIFDPIFIFGLDMGVRGAAMATMISQVIVFVVFIYVIFHRKSTFVEFRLRHFRYRSAIMLSILKIGLPSSVSFMIMSVGGATFNKILSTYSHHAVAAYQIANRIEMLSFMPIIALSTGCVTLVGMFYGAGEYGKLRDIIRYTMVRAIMIGLAAFVLIFPFAPQIMLVFRPNAEILDYGVSYLRVIAFAFPLVPIGMISGRVMQGMGKGLPVLILTTLRVLGLSAPLALYFAYALHKPVVWIWYAMLISVAVAATLGITWLMVSLRQAEQGPHPAAPATDAPQPAVEAAG